MITVREAIAECLAQLKNKKAINTIRTYSDGFDVFMEYLGETVNSDISLLTPQHFIDYPTWLISRYEDSKRSAKNRESAAKYLRNWLVHERYLAWDYTNEADYKFAQNDAFSEREYPIPNVIAEADIEKVIEFVPHMETYYPIERTRNIALIYLMASSGIRVAEVSALKVGDIDITLRKAFVRKAKGKKSFFAPLSRKAVEAIQAYWIEREWYAKDDPAFARHDKRTGEDRASISDQGIQLMIRDLRSQAGVPGLTPHKFRHYVAMKVSKEFGIDIASQWLHHSSIETTKGYTHVLDQDVMDAAKKMYDD